MHLTKSDIFWKSWLWSVICGLVVASVFYFVTGLINKMFRFSYGGVAFVDLLIILAIAGSYFGAGYVGSRIAHKYHYDVEKRFVRRYTWYSIVTFLLLVAVTYSPLSFLGILWSLVAPYCVIKALDFIQKEKK
ncbi:MAG TPA: hypothetical protein VLA92_02620 [Candidatus Saccharimonadales bacterium]|nr:hypothetical protein [Candidatus Saccharimonadales bacterium]